VLYFFSIVVNGLLAGTIYALIALAFVVIYKSSRMINFAVGEWVMFGSLLVAAGMHLLTLGLGPSIALAEGGMIALAAAFGHLVLRRLVGRPLVSIIMITLGLGALMRGVAAIVFQRVPSAIPLQLPSEPLIVHGIIVALDRLIAAGVAAFCITVVSWFYQASRTGLALRAIADDPTLAMSAGIDVQWHFILTWAIAGMIAVIAGVLWTLVAGGGISVFPIVIIGGLDSIPGTIIGAMIIGLLESLSSAYLDPSIGGGFGTVASCLVLIAVLFVRPQGLFGHAFAERV
jgi:branched-chain amino acid transport system permease protein